jgi:hypothetical protein
MRLLSTVASLCLFIGNGNAQGRSSRSDYPSPALSVLGTLLLPTVGGDQVYKDITEPVGQADGCVQVPIFRGLGIGGGFRYMFIDLAAAALSPEVLRGGIRRNTFYGQVQYERYVGPSSFLWFAGRVGYSEYSFESQLTCNDGPRAIGGLFFSPTAGIYLHAAENLAFGFTLGYEREVAEMKPDLLCLASYPGRSTTKASAPFQYYTVGMGFSARIIPAEKRGSMGIAPGKR